MLRTSSSLLTEDFVRFKVDQNFLFKVKELYIYCNLTSFISSHDLFPQDIC